jgi:Ca2+-binding RTX toxin-like protein
MEMMGSTFSAVGGNNVLDGEGGSNFLVGGQGNDTFYVNDLYATVPSWTTILGFHTGDAATVWGLTPDDFKLTWLDGGGAPGYTGLTVYATAANKPEVAVTIAGATLADKNSGHINVQFGHVTDSLGRPQPYMEISRLA